MYRRWKKGKEPWNPIDGSTLRRVGVYVGPGWSPGTAELDLRRIEVYRDSRRGEGCGEKEGDGWWRDKHVQRPGGGSIALGDIQAVHYGLSLEWE